MLNIRQVPGYGQIMAGTVIPGLYAFGPPARTESDSCFRAFVV